MDGIAHGWSLGTFLGIVLIGTVRVYLRGAGQVGNGRKNMRLGGTERLRRLGGNDTCCDTAVGLARYIRCPEGATGPLVVGIPYLCHHTWACDTRVIVPWKHALIAQFSSAPVPICPEVELKVTTWEHGEVKGTALPRTSIFLEVYQSLQGQRYYQLQST